VAVTATQQHLCIGGWWLSLHPDLGAFSWHWGHLPQGHGLVTAKGVGHAASVRAGLAGVLVRLIGDPLWVSQTQAQASCLTLASAEKKPGTHLLSGSLLTPGWVTVTSSSLGIHQVKCF
jgi:hypothetical protein